MPSPFSDLTPRRVGRGVVWVLEDSPLEAEMARRALASDHAVEIFADGPTVLERIANGSKPDALVLDCQLPTLSGLEVCRFIRESSDEMELPIIMLTVEGHRSDLVSGLDSGANDYLTKPYHVAELRARVGTLVRTRHLHRARTHRARELTLTAEIGALLTRGLDSTAELCASTIGRHLDASACCIRTADARGRMELTSFYGSVDSSQIAVTSVACDPPPRIIRFDEEAGPCVADESWAAARSRTFVELPLVVGARLVGALSVAVRRRLEPEEIDALATVADLVTLGLERARAERERAALLLAERGARNDADAANRAKDEFFAILGHELRNPLAPVATALQLMRLRGDGAMAKERAIIERQVDQITHLVDDLLDVSRITRGMVTLKRMPIELSEVVARAIETASPLLEQRRHRLDVEVPTKGLVVLGDSMRLTQVVSNLLTNAAKYTETGGRVMVSAEKSGRRACLRVVDSGIGIAPEMLPRVFEPFAQERQALDRAHGGLGLGLTIVAHLVRLHGGAVAAHSAGRGQGSTFTIELPLSDMAATAAPAPAVPATEERSTGALRVLVVDDNEDAADMLAEAIAMLDFDTRIAHDGPEAIRVVDEFKPQVALLDIGLPVMDGYELASRLRHSHGAESLRLVAITGYGQDSDRERTTRAGFDAHLVKPVDIHVVAKLLDRYRTGEAHSPR